MDKDGRDELRKRIEQEPPACDCGGFSHCEACEDSCRRVRWHREQAEAALKALPDLLEAADRLAEVLAGDAAHARASQERDALVSELCEAAGWQDRSYLHAVLHVGALVRNLRAEAATEARLRREAEQRLTGGRING